MAFFLSLTDRNFAQHDDGRFAGLDFRDAFEFFHVAMPLMTGPVLRAKLLRCWRAP